MMKGGGYGAESVENVESEKNSRGGSSGMSGQESNLPFARGVTMGAARNETPRE